MRLKTDYPTTSKDAVNLQYMMNAFYPVGALYISTLATNPTVLFGFGTWVAFGAGKTLVSVDANDSDFNASEKTGGAKTSSALIAHTHTGTTGGRNAAHTHTAFQSHIDGSGYGHPNGPYTFGSMGSRETGTESADHGHSFTSNSSGSGSSFSIMNPYITVYMFKRTV